MIIVTIGYDDDKEPQYTVGTFSTIEDAEYFADGVRLGLSYANNTDFRVEVLK